MQFLRQLPKNDRAPSCVTIGNFDGMHRGHQTILNHVIDVSRQENLNATVIFFEPQPIEFFNPNKAPARLMRLRDKIARFMHYPIDRLICLRFDHNIADLTADTFIQNVLLKEINTKVLVIGHDFQFGKNREGNYDYLVNARKRYQFRVDVINAVYESGICISSTKIRQSLEKGALSDAHNMLGYPYCMSGRVIHGAKRGGHLGFPTANIALHRFLSPICGIFSGYVHINAAADKQVAVIYVGTRPSYHEKNTLIEVHILDFNGLLYGEYLNIQFIEKLRNDLYFDNEKALIKQIEKDIDASKLSLERYEL